MTDSFECHRHPNRHNDQRHQTNQRATNHMQTKEQITPQRIKSHLSNKQSICQRLVLTSFCASHNQIQRNPQQGIQNQPRNTKHPPIWCQHRLQQTIIPFIRPWRHWRKKTTNHPRHKRNNNSQNKHPKFLHNCLLSSIIIPSVLPSRTQE